MADLKTKPPKSLGDFGRWLNDNLSDSWLRAWYQLTGCHWRGRCGENCPYWDKAKLWKSLYLNNLNSSTAARNRVVELEADREQAWTDLNAARDRVLELEDRLEQIAREAARAMGER